MALLTSALHVLLTVVAIFESCHSKFADNVLITGSNRGQGLEWAKQLSELDEPPEHIFATCRQADNKTYTKKLDELAKASKKAKIIILQLDVTKLIEIQSAVKKVNAMVGDKGLNVLINNAGIMYRGILENSTKEELMEIYEVNAVGPVIVTQQFLPLLRRAAGRATGGTDSMGTERAAIINISSILGSIYLSMISFYGYNMAKTALNMATALMSKDLKKDGIIVVAFHPGYVRTRMTGFKGDITTIQSIYAMMNTVQRLDENYTGGYYQRNGTPIPY